MANLENERMEIVWKKFLNDDKEAFAEIYNAYVDDLFRYGTKIASDVELVKDSIHEVFLDLFTNRKKHLQQPANLKFYLILALKRTLIRKLKRNRKSEHRAITESDFFEPQYSFEQELIEEETHQEAYRKIQDAIGKLPSKQKEAIYLRYNQGMEYEQISKILNVNIESVRKQIYRAVKSVRDVLDHNDLLLFSVFRNQWT